MHLIKHADLNGVLSTVVMAQSTHENFSRDEAVSPGSDRNFGLVMAGALALLSALNGWHHGRLWPWTATVAIAFLLPRHGSSPQHFVR